MLGMSTGWVGHRRHGYAPGTTTTVNEQRITRTTVQPTADPAVNWSSAARNGAIGGAVGGALGGISLLAKVGIPLLGKVTSIAGLARFGALGAGVGIATALWPSLAPKLDRNPALKAAVTGAGVGAAAGMVLPLVSPVFGGIIGAAVGYGAYKWSHADRQWDGPVYGPNYGPGYGPYGNTGVVPPWLQGYRPVGTVMPGFGQPQIGYGSQFPGAIGYGSSMGGMYGASPYGAASPYGMTSPVAYGTLGLAPKPKPAPRAASTPAAADEPRHAAAGHAKRPRRASKARRAKRVRRARQVHQSDRWKDARGIRRGSSPIAPLTMGAASVNSAALAAGAQSPMGALGSAASFLPASMAGAMPFQGGSPFSAGAAFSNAMPMLMQTPGIGRPGSLTPTATAPRLTAAPAMPASTIASAADAPGA